MGRTAIAASSIITPLGPYPTLPVTALALDLAWQAADASNSNQFTLGTGKYLILARNVHAVTGYTVTFTSVADSPFKRTGDITTYALAATKQMAFLVDQQVGWLQTDGMFYLTGSNASVEFCIIRLT
jgi:hypothetical protein